MMDARARELPGRIRFKYEESVVKMCAQEKALEKLVEAHLH